MGSLRAGEEEENLLLNNTRLSHRVGGNIGRGRSRGGSGDESLRFDAPAQNFQLQHQHISRRSRTTFQA